MHRFVSEVAAADLLEQVRWFNSVECRRCRSDPTVRTAAFGSINGICVKIASARLTRKTDTIFAH